MVAIVCSRANSRHGAKHAPGLSRGSIRIGNLSFGALTLPDSGWMAAFVEEHRWLVSYLRLGVTPS